MALRTDYTNETDSTDTHPAAHNETAAAVNTNTADLAALTARVAALESGNTAARVTALEARASNVDRLRRGAAGYWVYPWDPNSTPTTATHAGRHWRGARGTIPQSFDALMFEVTTAAAAGTTAKVAIYNTDSNGLPTTLAHGSAAIDCTTIGIKTATFTALPAGAYWFGVIPSADTVMRYINVAGGTFVTPSTTALAGLQGSNFGWQLFVSAFATNGVLPDPFPAPSANTVASTSPAVQLRLA